MIILGKKGWSEGKQIGSTARMLAALSPVQSLILQRKVRLETPVLVIYDGSDESRKALNTASRVCSPGSMLTILVPAEKEQAASEIFESLGAWIEEQDFQVRFRWVNDLKGKRISNLALVSGCDLVILAAKSKHFEPHAIVSMVENADCAVLLVR